MDRVKIPRVSVKVPSSSYDTGDQWPPDIYPPGGGVCGHFALERATKAVERMKRASYLDPTLQSLSREPYALDVIDLMASQARTLPDLAAQLRVPGRRLPVTMRLLASYGLVTRRDHGGTWDATAPKRAYYELTREGQRLASKLCQFDVWVAIYDFLHYP